MSIKDYKNYLLFGKKDDPLDSYLQTQSEKEKQYIEERDRLRAELQGKREKNFKQIDELAGNVNAMVRQIEKLKEERDTLRIELIKAREEIKQIRFAPKPEQLELIESDEGKKKCIGCEEMFTPKHPKQKYHSDLCRLHAFRKKHDKNDKNDDTL